MMNAISRRATFIRRVRWHRFAIPCSAIILSGCSTIRAPLEVTNTSDESFRLIARIPYQRVVSMPLGYPTTKGPYFERHRTSVQPARATWVGGRPTPRQVHEGTEFNVMDVAIERPDKRWLVITFNAPPTSVFRLTIDRDDEGHPTVIAAEPEEYFRQILSKDDANAWLARKPIQYSPSQSIMPNRWHVPPYTPPAEQSAATE